MRSVILLLTLVVTSTLALAYSLFQQVPTPVPNSVIAEKNDGSGQQVATLLPPSMTTDQHRLMTLAFEVAQENGIKNPELVQAILLQETGAGSVARYRVANPGPNAYFGPMQVKLMTAREVLSRWPKLFEQFDFHTRTDDEIKANLILNERFNIEIATKYLKILQTQYGLRGRELLTAYNRGPNSTRVASSDYAAGAESKLVSYRVARR